MASRGMRQGAGQGRSVPVLEPYMAPGMKRRPAKKGKAKSAGKPGKALEEEKMAREFEDLRLGTRHRIIIGDSRSMRQVETESVHLIVTSPPPPPPPPCPGAKSRPRRTGADSYLDDMRAVLSECYRVLCRGRKLCLSVSDIREEGDSGARWRPLGPELVLLASNDVGFEIVDRIFWSRIPPEKFQYGSLPFPPSPVISDSVEYVYVLRKPGRGDYSYVPGALRRASRLRREEYVEFTRQIWSMRRAQLEDGMDRRIAPFPDDLPARCIRLYSFVGDTVLDPFGGRGTTTRAAIEGKRSSILYEKNRKRLARIRRYILPGQGTPRGGGGDARVEFGG